ncbi:MAG: 2Fe-2S iron-sulfur cluster binding domain-containing protein [Chitinophaga sp.]|uniref:ferredoxin--NADP reductase n=1 Tax=Chitinophaga sp. TaxID=1869181 RepID=UPI001B1F3F2F|nr:ferredoxin--NADP reductase [Chitinophaga sp.]MBO9729704.1 2Fe-2S iron-sulfur cluster binding domain-containing protein [Chitinophaga sp.]
MNDVQTWRTARIIPETASAVTIRFDTGDQPFIYQPGQFINLTLIINDKTVTRSYSLSSVPGKDQQPAITVKAVPGGIMSNYILTHASDIKEWQVTGPFGAFVPVDTTWSAKHIVLLAGGSGITPLYSIARAVTERSPDTHVTLIYANRTPEEIIFSHDIASWQNSHPERIQVHHALSAHGDAALPNLVKGRLNKLVTRKLIKQSIEEPHTNVHYFICGPTGLMKMHQEMLEAMQVPAENIFLEWFSPEPVKPDEILPDTPQEVLLHFYEQSNLLDVNPGKTILEAALEDLIPLPYSCKGGTCGVCTAKLTAGKVKMRHNYALRPSDIDEGMILLCQSFPLTADVTVEIG